MLHCANTGTKISPLVPEQRAFGLHIHKDVLMRTLNVAAASSYGSQFVKKECAEYLNY